MANPEVEILEYTCFFNLFDLVEETVFKISGYQKRVLSTH